MELAATRSTKRQTVVNLATTIVNYTLTLAISFFLTPYIVKKLGVGAYGFIGLSNNLLSYTSLITIALTSMSGRFISIHFHKGDIATSNKYLSSTYFANCGFAIIIGLICGGFTIFMDYFLNIPPDLVRDVRFLFTILFLNTVLSMFFSFTGNAPFIRNRLDLGNIRAMIGSIIRVVLLIIAYGFFPAHLWYYGAVGMISSIYYVSASYYLYRKLTPEAHVSVADFDMKRVWEMMKAGAWNLLSQLSSILNMGLELLLANIFVNDFYMGVISITKTLPGIILSFFASIGGIFHPEYIKLYAQGDMEGLRLSILKSIRILGLFTAAPCAVIFSFSDVFYSAWLHTHDYELMYYITCVGMFGIVFSLPTQSVWYVFTMTTTVKRSSLTLIKYGVANIVLTIIAVKLTDDQVLKVYMIAGIQSLLMALRMVTFLPIYAAKVLGFPKYSLLWPLLKVVLVTAVISVIGLGIKFFFVNDYNWMSLIIGAATTAIMGFGVNYMVSLSDSDRAFIRTRILKLKQ